MMALNKRRADENEEQEADQEESYDPRFPSYESKESKEFKEFKESRESDESDQAQQTNSIAPYRGSQTLPDRGEEEYRPRQRRPAPPQRPKIEGSYINYVLRRAKIEFILSCVLFPSSIAYAVFVIFMTMNTVLSGFRDLFYILAVGAGFALVLLLFGKCLSVVGDKTDLYGGVSLVLYKLGNFLYILALYALFAAIVVAVVAGMFLFLVSDQKHLDTN